MTKPAPFADTIGALADGTPVVDLSGLTVTPGFIDTHSHLVGDVQTAGVPANDHHGCPGRAAERENCPRHPGGRLHDRPGPGSVPRLRRLRAARHDQRGGRTPVVDLAGEPGTAPLDLVRFGVRWRRVPASA